jgi:hypothetical protein
MEEGGRFYDYFAVIQRKFTNRAASVYPGWGKNPDVMIQQTNMAGAYERLKDSYRYETCDECGLTPQPSWTRYSLDALARHLGKATNDDDLSKLGKNLADAYLSCASVPNEYIYASISPILRRLSEQPGQFVFDPSAYALSHAHVLILLALGRQNRHFQLGIDSTLDWRHRDRTPARSRLSWIWNLPHGITL